MVLLISLKHKTRIARQLTPSNWLSLAEAWWVLLAFYLALRWTSYERLSKNDILTHTEGSNPASQLDVAQRLGRLVVLASRLHLLPMTCLVRALALRWMLARHGIPSQLRIGANKSLEGLHAHAWVEIQGQAISEAAGTAEKFHVLVSGEGSLL
jgi:hypothetical protein